MKERLLRVVHKADGFQRQRAWAAVPFAVLRKFSEDQAGNLAALIAYYAFFSIFPLILAATTILGYVLGGNPHLEHTIEQSWIAQVPLIGSSLSRQHGLTGNAAALIVGLVLAIWSGLAVARTAQTAFNSVYNVPMVERPGTLDKTRRALGLLVIVGVGLVVSTGVSGVATGAGSLVSGVPFVNYAVKVAAAVIAIGLDVGIFLLAFNRLTVRELGWRDSLPGAVFAALAWYALQLGSTAIVEHKLHGDKGTYGQFAIVIVLLSWFYLASQLVLLGAEINVVLGNRLWPRALVDRPQTDADYRALDRYAEQQRYVHPEAIETDYPAEQQDAGEPTAGRHRRR